MELDYRFRASLKAELLDNVTGLPGSIPVGLNFGGTGNIITPAAAATVSWEAETGETLTIDLASAFSVVATGGAVLTEQLETDGSEPMYIAAANFLEVVLLANPLAKDAFGNPVTASRSSEITITASGGNDTVHTIATLAVTTENQAAIYRRASPVKGTYPVSQIVISGVTANACKVLIHFGGAAAV